MRYYETLYEEDYEDAMPGDDGNIAGDLSGDDGILESLMIVGLAAALVFLLMYRQQRQAQARREAEDAQRQQMQQQQPVAEQGVQQGAVWGAPPVQEQGVQPGANGPPAGFEWIAGPGGVGH